MEDAEKPKAKEHICSFCDKPQRAVAQMIARSDPFTGSVPVICNECISECVRLMLKVEKKALYNLKPKEDTNDQQR